MKEILFLIGSESDRERVKPAIDLIREKGLTYDLHVYSAHRNLGPLLSFLDENAEGYSVILAAAGLSAALPGIVASRVTVPVIGIPLVSGHLAGVDALLSILQLPKGVPVATMGVGSQGALNAVHLAERILKVNRERNDA